MTPALLHRLIVAVSDDVIAHADELTALDQAVGDGDHGVNMKRGFEAVRADAAATAEKPLPEALKAIGTQLVMKVGGASGPLYGTLFLALSKEIAPDGSNLPTAFGKAVEAVKARGKLQPGQKDNARRSDARADCACRRRGGPSIAAADRCRKRR
jgi:dihydroxyacetone kinase-like protein